MCLRQSSSLCLLFSPIFLTFWRLQDIKQHTILTHPYFPITKWYQCNFVYCFENEYVPGLKSHHSFFNILSFKMTFFTQSFTKSNHLSNLLHMDEILLITSHTSSSVDSTFLSCEPISLSNVSCFFKIASHSSTLSPNLPVCSLTWWENTAALHLALCYFIHTYLMCCTGCFKAVHLL